MCTQVVQHGYSCMNNTVTVNHKYKMEIYMHGCQGQLYMFELAKHHGEAAQSLQKDVVSVQDKHGPSPKKSNQEEL